MQELVDAGIKVHVFGDGWQLLECRQAQNLMIMNSLDSVGCLKKLCQTKLSLNVMPWFKDGAHDRIFNSMLNGSVCLTDSSLYLDDILKDQVNSSIYTLENMDRLPEMAVGLLENPSLMQKIADGGYETAQAGHTWAHRAKVLHELVEKG